MIDLQNEMSVTPGMVCATVSATYFTDTAVVCPSALRVCYDYILGILLQSRHVTD